MACVVLIEGIPGSGKSTFVDFLVKHKRGLFSNSLCSCKNIPSDRNAETDSLNMVSRDCDKCYEIVAISYDELCTVPQQQKLVDIPNGWKDFRKDFLNAVEHYICFLHHIKCDLPDISSRTKVIFNWMTDKYSCFNDLRSRLILLVEDNFYYSSMRYKWFQLCRKYEIGFCQIFLECAVNVALQRNNNRATNIPENVIQTMSGRFELPDAQKNPWEKFSFIFSSEKEYAAVPIDDIVQLIKTATDNPPETIADVSEQKKEAQMKCSENVIHQTDKILRNLTGQVIQRLLTEKRSKEDLKILTSKISQARHKLLRELSEGTLFLPVSVTEEIRNCGIEVQGAETEKYLFVLLQNKIAEMLETCIGKS